MITFGTNSEWWSICHILDFNSFCKICEIIGFTPRRAVYFIYHRLMHLDSIFISLYIVNHHLLAINFKHWQPSVAPEFQYILWNWNMGFIELCFVVICVIKAMHK